MIRLSAIDVRPLLTMQGQVYLGPAELKLLAALLLVPFAVDNGIDPTHPAPQRAALALLSHILKETHNV
jgi:hypothetical protein